MKHLIVGAVVALFLVGCATGPGSTKDADASAQDLRRLSPEEQVSIRAEQRWRALIEGRWEDAYAFLAPGYRQANSLDRYKSLFVGANVKWLEVRRGASVCDAEDRCTARSTVDIELIGGARGLQGTKAEHQMEETWLLSEEGWFHLPRR